MLNFYKRFFIVFVFSLFFPVAMFASTISRPMSNSGLVGYWNFEEGKGSAYVYDRSGFGNNGTFVNGPVSTSSNTGLGQALNLDGIDDYVSIGNQNNLDFPTTDFSMTIWVKPNNNGFIVSKFANGPSQSYLLHVSGSTGRTFICDGVNCAITQGSINLVDGNWHFLTVTVNRNGNIILYVDSRVDGTPASTATVGNISGNSSVDFGDRSGGNGDYFSGKMDEVRIYNRVLSADEVSRLYKIQKPRVTGGVTNSGLVGYWPLEEGFGTRTEDVSFNNNNGTVSGSPVWANGKNGKAILFDGVDDYIDLGNHSSLSPANTITMSGWVKVNDFSLSRVILAKDDGGANSTFLRPQLGGSARCGVGGTSVTAGTISVGNWYHMACVYDGTNVILYINGVQVGTPTAKTGSITYSNTNWNIGARQGGTALLMNGIIDDVRIYDRALSASEIYSMYSGSKASIVNKSKADRLANDLVGYWTFDANKMAGASVYDSSASGNNGTITNGAVPAIGQVGQALSLNGVNQNISIPDSNSLDLSSSYSVSTWVYGTSYNVAPNKWIGIVTKGNTGEAAANNHNYILGYNNNAGFGAGYRWLFDLENAVGANCDLLGNAPAATSTWYHLVGVFDNPADTMSLYVNGELQGQATCALVPNTNTLPVLIGDDAHSSSIPWTGKIDDVRIYNRALSADEAKALYNMGR